MVTYFGESALVDHGRMHVHDILNVSSPCVMPANHRPFEVDPDPFLEAIVMTRGFKGLNRIQWHRDLYRVSMNRIP